MAEMDMEEKLVELLTNIDVEMPISTALYLIAGGVTVQEWISVKDRLPKEDADVLCFRGGHIGAMMDVYTYKGDKWEDSYGFRNYAVVEGITHWMPLPQAPKGE